MGRLSAAAWSVAIVTLFLPPPAAADATRSRVALVRSESSDRLLRDASTRVRAELVSAGFEVIEVDRPLGDARSGVESAASGSDSFATVALDRAGEGAFADVWIGDHVTGKTLVRRLEVSAGANAATVLAIRALELLRASLLELARPAPPHEPAVVAPQDVTAWIEPVLPTRADAPRRPFAGAALGVQVLALHGTNGLGMAFGPSLRVSHELARPFFARLSWAGPLFGPEPETARGRASVRQEMASLDLGFSSEARPFGAYAWLGLGAFHLRTVGEASTPYRAKTDSVWSFESQAGMGALARITERTLLTAEVGVVVLLPYPVVVIADDDAGKAGAPSISLSLGVVVGL